MKKTEKMADLAVALDRAKGQFTKGNSYEKELTNEQGFDLIYYAQQAVESILEGNESRANRYVQSIRNFKL